MADSSIDHVRLKSVRELVLYKLKVDIKYGDELRNGISKCLEEVLGVSKDTLSNVLLKKFDTEVQQMYTYLPTRMKKFARNKFVVVKKGVAFFSKKIELVEVPEAPNVEVPEAPNVEVLGTPTAEVTDPIIDVSLVYIVTRYFVLGMISDDEHLYCFG